jgi:hypothetical protein
MVIEKRALWIGINVRRIIVIYFMPGKDEKSVEEMQTIFRGTFSGAAKVGWTVGLDLVHLQDETVVSIWPHINLDSSLLTDPAEKLFWSQDIAIMTMSLMRTAVRSKVALMTKNPPRPF